MMFAAIVALWYVLYRWWHPQWRITSRSGGTAVREAHAKLWNNGGCISQCEFGPAAKPENVRQVYTSWDAVST